MEPPVSQQARRREKVRAWQDIVKQEAKKYWTSEQQPATGLIMLKITYFYTSSSMDIDNIVKPIQDAIKGIAYVDDEQITDFLVRKRDLSGNLSIENITPILAEGFARGNEFLHIVIAAAPDQEVID